MSRSIASCWVLILVAFLTCRVAAAQEFHGQGFLSGPAAPPPSWIVEEETRPGATYDAIDASVEAHQRAEARRLGNIDRQLQSLENMRWYAGMPSAYAEHRAGPSLDAMHAYGIRGDLRRAERHQRRYGRAHLPVFEPWPIVGGNIWGYPFFNPIEQPLGHRTTRTGPGTWVTQPLYSQPAPTRAPPREPVESPPPMPPAPPAAPGIHGPRAF
ncbi:MAG: hypothetical protein HQ581_05090 [Planctomycetes bacterium]|nr:hypothetical protein [Planctomycetota bacterium]